MATLPGTRLPCRYSLPGEWGQESTAYPVASGERKRADSQPQGSCAGTQEARLPPPHRALRGIQFHTHHKDPMRSETPDPRGRQKAEEEPVMSGLTRLTWRAIPKCPQQPPLGAEATGAGILCFISLNVLKETNSFLQSQNYNFFPCSQDVKRISRIFLFEIIFRVEFLTTHERN